MVRAELAKFNQGFEEMAEKAGHEKELGRSLLGAARNVEPGTRRAGGRPGLGDAHYRHIAYAYLDLQEKGTSRGLSKMLAVQENVSPSTIRDWVRGARTRGFLSATSQGRSGSLPGPKLGSAT